MDILNLLKANLILCTIIASILTCALFIYYQNKQSNGLFLLNLRYRYSFFGRIRKLAKNPSINDNWFHSETQICQDYKPHYQQINKSSNYYTKCKEYLDIVGETGRKPLTPLMIIGLFAVLVLEAWGFSYTMAGFLDISASENTRKIMAWLVAITFAISLATVTHKMGHEIHRNKIIDNIRHLWAADKNAEGSLTQQAEVGVASIEAPTDINEKAYIRRLNRLELGKSHKTYAWITSSIILIIVIASILTFIRMKALEQAQTQDSLCNVSNVSTGGNAMPDFNNLYTDVPQEVLDTNKHVVDSGKNQMCKATEQGSWATFGILAILFMALQAFSTWVSTAFGFAGKQSKEAYNYTYKHATAEDFDIYHDNRAREIADAAQKALIKLQTRMADKLPHITSSAEVKSLLSDSNKRNFYQFLDKEHANKLSSEILRQEMENQTAIKQAQLTANARNNLTEIELTRINQEEKLKNELKEKFLNQNKEETQEEKNRQFIENLEKELGVSLTQEQRMEALNKFKEQESV